MSSLVFRNHKISIPRLKRRKCFVRIARHGKKYATPSVVLQAWQRTNVTEKNADEEKTRLASSPRIGYTVTRKVGNAVTRNRVKRRLRAAADQVMLRYARLNTDFVLIGRAGTINRPFEKVVADLKSALIKLNCHRD